MIDAPYALLDDSASDAAAPSSRLYTGFVREHRCNDPASLEVTIATAEADQQAGLHALVLADYEWGARLQGLAPEDSDGDALRLLMFRSLRRLTANEAGAWLAAQADAEDRPDALPTAGLLPLVASLDEAGFDAAIAAIHDAIRAGETYQVNLTHRLDGLAYGAPMRLYLRLRARQPVRFGAFVALPPGGAVRHVLSLSPELFLSHHDGLLTAIPMKGTAAVGHNDDDPTWLQQDPKNRAENLMIVDLLRNDLGRVAQTGSVRVPALFALETHGSVVQMTSTVQARRRSDVGFAALLRATFPCGSITGAPKRRTMQWIDRLETRHRGLYTGAIGWWDAAPETPAGQACGDFCLSVAIRTLTVEAPRADGLRPVTLGVGGGIVLDSVAAAEREECRLKARFATALGHEFELFETLFATAVGGARHAPLHLARLGASALALGFRFDAAATAAALHHAAATLPPGDHRLRLALRHDGTTTLTSAPLATLPPGPVRLRLAPAALTPHALSAHKTTLRARYDAGLQEAEAAGCFDTLFFTPDGRLVEGARSNVFVQSADGRWWTPPLADGALPGVMRGVLLASPGWAAGETTLRREDVLGARALMVCNALRGALPASLLDGANVISD